MSRAGWILALLMGTVLLMVGFEALLLKPHYFIGFNAVVGLVSCFVVVIASKALGKALLQRPEDRDAP